MVAPAGSARLVTARAGLIGGLNKNQARLKEKPKLSARLSRVRQLSLARHYFLQAGGRCPVARFFLRAKAVHSRNVWQSMHRRRDSALAGAPREGQAGNLSLGATLTIAVR